MQPIKSETPGREIYWGFLLLSKRTINSHRKSPVEKSTGDFCFEESSNWKRYKIKYLSYLHFWRAVASCGHMEIFVTY
jgi:hypothetical protein